MGRAGGGQGPQMTLRSDIFIVHEYTPRNARAEPGGALRSTAKHPPRKGPLALLLSDESSSPSPRSGFLPGPYFGPSAIRTSPPPLATVPPPPRPLPAGIHRRMGKGGGASSIAPLLYRARERRKCAQHITQTETEPGRIEPNSGDGFARLREGAEPSQIVPPKGSPLALPARSTKEWRTKR